jgi:hypothetical protein
MMIKYAKVQTFDEIAAKARKECSGDAPVHNLSLSYELPIEVVDSQFMDIHGPRATKWTSEDVPEELPFTHGQYFRGERGMNHVAEQLKEKSDSRRALLTLIGMDDILNSGDEPIPAFLLLQFGIDGECLFVTATFRALEVSEFLPINLAEIGLHIRRLRREFLDLSVVRLKIDAFQAYSKPGFNCLVRPEMDRLEPGSVTATAMEGDVNAIRRWLEEKRSHSSVAGTHGLKELLTGAKAAKTFSSIFLTAIQNAISALDSIKMLRRRGNQGAPLDEEWARLDKAIGEALSELR